MSASKASGETHHELGAGALAAEALGLAADLVGRAAAASEQWPEATAIEAQAQALVRRANRLGERNRAAYGRARRILAGQIDDERQSARDHLLGQALAEAAKPPLDLAEAAADLTLLGIYLAEHVADPMRADALAAAAIASGISRGAAHLVAANLGAVPHDTRVERAFGAAARAAAAVPVGP